VHRDIKPANIMLPRPDWPMLADFGIAKLIDESDQLTPPGQSVGTAIYMAPERAGSSAVDARTDLYSVGVVLYEMLTGRVPYDGVSPVEVLRKHIHEPLPPPRDINPQLPAAAEPVLLRSLAKRPADRYQSAREMAGDLQRLIGQLERLAAERQLNALLQQPAQRAAAPPAQLDPYKTREFPTDALPAAQGYLAPPAPPDRAPPPPAPPLPPRYDAPARSRSIGLRGLIAGVVLLAALGAALLARGVYGRAGDRAPTTAITSPTAAPGGLVSGATALPSALPTAVPAEPTPLPQPAENPAPPAPEPAEATVMPTQPPVPAPAQTTPQVAQEGDTVTIVLEDTDWQGGFRRAGGQTYGGRTATWIYGTSTEYSTMQARFVVAGTPAGTVTLSVEGMDSEGRAKTPIQILVNGTEIYNGPNPLPDDDQPLESGTWASQSWMFDAGLLRPGENEISIRNLAEGAFSRPPFFMLDYARVVYGV
jgi:hypothetical protein